ncbi:DUF7284 family protein [Halorubrum depositum]|uniref:DUF7284 family protein n=1 Tax=Halorubrum depositum TaxID=2583992 RepID=UPI0011AB0E95|nr:hypothetical protein [Halorubrum depositum]
MTSTVLDVTVLLLCVSASVVALGGVGGDAGTNGPTADETADRLVTETVTVRYRAPGAANDTRTVHATRAELLALLVAGRGSDDDRASRDGEDVARDAFESRATEAVAAELGGRTRIDATVPAAANRERGPSRSTSDRRVPSRRPTRRGAGAVAVSGGPNAPRPLRLDTVRTGSAGPRTETDRPTDRVKTVAAGPEPPRNADVATAVVTHPAPDPAEAEGPIRIVVRRW